jgi:ATP synthase protein I
MIRVMSNTDSNGRNSGSGYASLAGLGFAFLLTLAVLTLIGLFVDRLLGTLPLFLLIGLAVGFAGGLYYMYQSLKKFGGG